MRKIITPTIIILLYCLIVNVAFSQGTGKWTAVSALAPHANLGGMLLLSDGTVLVKSSSGGGDGWGNTYDRLKPDLSGSYVKGTWSSIAPMINTRKFYSSQVLKDGRVYVAGGEYGTGGSAAEVYDPLTNIWTATPAPGAQIDDANSEILEDGRVLQALVVNGNDLKRTLIYNPVTNTYIVGPTALGIHNESVWIKLPDNSILFVNRLSTSSERYIPIFNIWIQDATVPVQLYDPFGDETGGALLLPDGRALFLGSSGHNAYYTPSGGNAPGTWTAAPDFPNGQGTPDAPAAMMVNGRVLCDASPIPFSIEKTDIFTTPTTFYEFNPVTNAFTKVAAPGGGATLDIGTFSTNFLNLPDGNILYSAENSNQYYIYTPAGGPIANGKPTVTSVTPTGNNTYKITGTLFNGISEGVSYGDDWQMNSNYPLVRLVNGNNVYYCRTSNWNSTGVRRGNAADNATFTLPSGLPTNVTYCLYVVVNGIASDSKPFSASFDITITGNYSTILTQSSTWIKSTGQTTILSTANVKLIANSAGGYISLKPGFLAKPTSGKFIATTQTFSSCNPTPGAASSERLNSQPSDSTLSDQTTPEESKEHTFSISPNPTKGSFHIELAETSNVTLLIYNVNGYVVYRNFEKQNGTIEIDISDLPSGIYFVRATSGIQVWTKKVIKE